MSKMQAVTAVGALADPVRRSLYQYIARRYEPVSREEIAKAMNVSPSKAKFHLDRLEREGLVDVEQRRLTGRSGPGAGRPAKLYRRASKEWRVSLPERRYDIVGSVLASAVEQATAGGDLSSAISASAYARGLLDAGGAVEGAQVSSTPDRTTDSDSDRAPDSDEALARAEQTLERLGYEPEQRESELVLRNCPFDALADAHREVVCAINQQYVQGVLDATCEGALESHFAPQQGFCCVVARQRHRE